MERFLPVYDGFKDWQDVANNFTDGVYEWSDAKEQAKALIDIPEPEEVLLAINHYESYSGSAWIVYRIGEEYFEVHGGHCSCYGFEGQWEPEDCGTAKEFLEALKKRPLYEYDLSAAYMPLLTAELEKRI